MVNSLRIVLLIEPLLLALCAGCNEKPPTAPYEDGYLAFGERPEPVINGITPPAGQALANVSTLAITGENFDPIPEHNLVFFGDIQIPVVSASSTQLTVKAPDILPKDSLRYSFSIKIGVYKAYLYSNDYPYTLLSAAPEVSVFSPTDVLSALTTDAEGNAYISVRSGSSTSGVLRVTPTGTRSLYSPAFNTTILNWHSMDFGPDSALYCVAGRTQIWRVPSPAGPVPSGGLASTIWLSQVESGVNLDAIDIDAQGNIWGGGPSGKLARVKMDKSAKTFLFDGIVRAVRVHSSYLYVAGRRGLEEKVWRLPIVSNDSLAAEEEYFDLRSVSQSGGQINALAFSADGDLYVGTDAAAGIIIVHSSMTTELLYPGVVQSPTVGLAWGKGFDLFQARAARSGSAPTLVKINTLENGAEE